MTIHSFLGAHPTNAQFPPKNKSVIHYVARDQSNSIINTGLFPRLRRS